MSTPMTDHAAEARRILDAPGIVTRDNEARQNAAEAQVHATLALAEEQRTANLIAYLSVGPAPTTLDGRLGQARIRHEIAARLGLTPTTPNQEQDR